jgi:hypothetical protein
MSVARAFGCRGAHTLAVPFESATRKVLRSGEMATLLTSPLRSKVQISSPASKANVRIRSLMDRLSAARTAALPDYTLADRAMRVCDAPVTVSHKRAFLCWSPVATTL